MTAGDKGTFTAKWEDLTEWTQTLFLSGRQINTTPDHIKSLTGSYAVQGQPSEGVYYGYASTFADESGEEPVLTEVYVTKMLPNISKETSAAYIGDFESELSDRNKHYSVYLLPVTDQTSPFLAVPPQKYTKQQCWIVEEEADAAFAAGNAEQSTVDLLAMYQQVQEMGIKLNKLTDTSFFVFAAKGSGDCQLRKNEILFETDGLTVPVQTPTVMGDANCDGVLDVSDAVLTARVLVEDIEAEISQQGLVNADTDGSGNLETNDLTRMLQAIAKKIKL